MSYKKSQLARLASVQALYKLQFLPHADIEDVIEMHGIDNLNIDLLRWIVSQVTTRSDSLKGSVEHLELRGEIVDMIILCCGILEIIECRLHYKIIIGSYMRVAYLIGSKSFTSVLNRVLDDFAKTHQNLQLIS
jgi:transcription termination factor NusB